MLVTEVPHLHPRQLESYWDLFGGLYQPKLHKATNKSAFLASKSLIIALQSREVNLDLTCFEFEMIFKRGDTVPSEH